MSPLPTSAQMSASAKPHKARNEIKRLILSVSHSVVLLLSLLLIVYISYDTFTGIPFLTNHSYMVFQLWVCIFFIVDFFIELIIATDKKFYLKARWLFLLISIPYLNIINQFHLHLSDEVLFFIRFVPLLRGTYALAMVLGYVSHNRAVSLVTQYVAILLVLIYSISLIFYYEEHGVNPGVHDFWDALYWAAMETTTVGSDINAVTPLGKIASVILPTAGVLMLPLFTVMITTKVQSYDSKYLHFLRSFAPHEDEPVDGSGEDASSSKGQ